LFHFLTPDFLGLISTFATRSKKDGLFLSKRLPGSSGLLRLILNKFYNGPYLDFSSELRIVKVCRNWTKKSSYFFSSAEFFFITVSVTYNIYFKAF
jgi:hypothetical protein